MPMSKNLYKGSLNNQTLNYDDYVDDQGQEMLGIRLCINLLEILKFPLKSDRKQL